MSAHAAGPSGLVYRDSVIVCPQAQLVDELHADLAITRRAVGGRTTTPTCGGADPARAAAVRALLSAAALEGALEDVGDAGAARRVMPLTDQIAAVVTGVAGVTAAALPDLPGPAELWRTDSPLRSSRPEGFAYYGVAPARLARAAAATVPAGRPVVVIGIRTIGVALSAVTAVVTSRSGCLSERFTVRPGGHPYRRQLALTATNREAVRRGLQRQAFFLVVDEGPGLSGSSFLAVGEALLALGVSGRDVCLFGTRPVDPAGLVTQDPVRRWAHFRHGHASGQGWRSTAETDLSGGLWRSRFWSDPAAYPAAWPAVERLKAMSEDGHSLRRFVGLGRCGDRCHQRALALADHGWAPPVVHAPDAEGFARYRFVPGRPLAAGKSDQAIVRHIARYLVARARLFPVVPAPEARASFEQMTRFNVRVTLGLPHDDPRLPRLHHAPEWPRPTLVDGRMQPHEWLAVDGGGLLKTDGADHGDDHFFPGPTDIAWDLAGAIVEWRLDRPASAALLRWYQQGSGDDPRPRLGYFLCAYLAFSARYAAMAAHTCPADDAGRWRAAERGYTRMLRVVLEGDPHPAG